MCYDNTLLALEHTRALIARPLALNPKGKNKHPFRRRRLGERLSFSLSQRTQKEQPAVLLNYSRRKHF
jgi:hypothetical protein